MRSASTEETSPPSTPNVGRLHNIAQSPVKTAFLQIVVGFVCRSRVIRRFLLEVSQKNQVAIWRVLPDSMFVLTPPLISTRFPVLTRSSREISLNVSGPLGWRRTMAVRLQLSAG